MQKLSYAGLLAAVAWALLQSGIFATRSEVAAMVEQLRAEHGREYLRRDDLKPEDLVREKTIYPLIEKMDAKLDRLAQDNQEIKVKLARLER